MADPKTVTVQERLQAWFDIPAGEYEDPPVDAMRDAIALLDRCQALLGRVFGRDPVEIWDADVAEAREVLTQLNGGRNVG